MRWLRCCAVLLAILASAGAVAQQAYSPLRHIPPQARSATMTVPYAERVVLNGKLFHLAPGAQIRDARNLIVLPINLQNLPDGSNVRYLLDGNGDVYRVWMLTPEELGAKVDSPE